MISHNWRVVLKKVPERALASCLADKGDLISFLITVIDWRERKHSGKRRKMLEALFEAEKKDQSTQDVDADRKGQVGGAGSGKDDEH